MQCARCGKPIDPAVHGRWVLPKGAGVETVCMACARRQTLEPRPGVTLIDKDGNEYPLDEEQKQA